jgi:hypothetical protein
MPVSKEQARIRQKTAPLPRDNRPAADYFQTVRASARSTPLFSLFYQK